MTWQEYQEAVGHLYEQMEGLGTVRRNVSIPDRITGQNRQVDTLLTIEVKGHSVSLIVDAKFHAGPIDVKEVESVAALADAVGAQKSVIVALNGWTKPAMLKAQHLACDLRLLSLEEALDLLVSDKWMMCPSCQKDCVVLDQNGMVEMSDASVVWWLGGACRECRHLLVWCQDCGEHYQVPVGTAVNCNCGYHWRNETGVLEFSVPDRRGSP